MKKLTMGKTWLIFCASCTTLFAACQDSNNEDIDNQTQFPQIQISISDTELSRTIISGNSVSWADGDRIGIFYGSGEICTPFTVAVDKNGNATATSETELDWQKGEVMYALYPYAEGLNKQAGTFTIPSTQNQTDAEASTLGDNDILVAEPVTWSSNEVAVAFHHTVAFIDFTIENASNDAMTIESVSISSTNNVFPTEGTLDITKQKNDDGFATFKPTNSVANMSVLASGDWRTISAGEDACLRMAIIPTDLSSTIITVTFKTSLGETTKTTFGKDFKAGVAYQFSESIGWNGESSNVDGLTSFKFLANDNSGIYQDITFTKQSDNSYAANVVYEVDLANVIPTFDYTGNVSFNGKDVESGKSAVNFPNDALLRFDGKRVKFHINRYYTIPTMKITTTNKEEITSKEEYLGCQITIDGKNMFEDYSTIAAADSIRGRGNSTWVFYDKKPYKLKLGKKASLLGIGEGKKYVLLANYRDPTNFMNAITFDMARYMGLKYTNSNKFIELYLNDEYIGMYQLTEQVEQGKNRVDIDKTNGRLLSLDYDDGPDSAPDAGDNFYSKIFNSSYSPNGLPVCIKHPEDLTEAQISAIRDEFGELEEVIDNLDYDGLKEIMDVQSFMDFLIIQEMTRNVELVTPRSMYLYKDNGIWAMGPAWDFDGGFAFDWGSMSTGHGYFGSQSWLMGEYPGGSNNIPDFFDKMFNNREFVADFQNRWNELNSGMLAYCYKQLEDYQRHCKDAMQHNAERWPINKDYNTEIQRMKSWLTTRANNYTEIIKRF